MDKSKRNYLSVSSVYGTKSITFDQYPPESWDWLFGGPDEPDKVKVSELWRTIPWLYRGTLLRAQAVASVPFAILNKKGKDITTSDEYEDPTGYLPVPSRMFWQIEEALTLEAKAYLLRVRAGNTKLIKGLRWWNPVSISLDNQELENGNIIFKRQVKGKPETFKPDQVVYFWPPDTYTEIGPPSSSPGRAALSAAGVLYNADKYVAAYFARGAVRAMILSTKGSTTESETNKLKAWWKSVTGGIKNAFEVLTLNAEGVTPTMIGDGLEGLHETSLTAEKREDISTALGLPQTKLFSGDASGLGGGGVVRQDDYRFYNETVVPECEFIAEVLNEQQLTMDGYRLQFRPEEMDIFQEDEAARADAVSWMVNSMQDIPLFLIAAEIAGYEISDDQITRLEAIDKERQAQRDEREKEEEDGRLVQQISRPDRQRLDDETARMRRKALRHVGKAIEFESDILSPVQIRAYNARLEHCETADEVKTVFEAAPDTDGELIAALRDTVKAMKG